MGITLVFIGDIFTPLGFNHGILYTPFILLVMLRGSRSLVIAAALAAIFLTLAGVLLSRSAPSDLPMSIVITNRIMSILLILLTAGLSLWLLTGIERLHESSRALFSTRQHLAEQYQLLRIASQLGHLGGWFADLPAGRVYWTDEAAAIYGLPPGYPISIEETIRFYHPEAQERIRQCINDCIQEGIDYEEELQLLTSDRRLLWVRVIGQAVRDDKGTIRRIQGAIQDISLRKKAEVLISYNQQRFHQLTDALPLVIWSARADGVVDYVSRALANYTGIGVAELLQPGYWITLLHPDDQEPSMNCWREAIQNGHDYTAEFRLRRYDGEYRWHLARATAIRNDDCEIEKWCGCTLDIHLQKLLERDVLRHAKQPR